MANVEQKPTQAMAPSLAAVARDDIVAIEVGPEHARYQIHKSLLTHYSDYFRKALRDPWKEAQEGVVPLYDVGSTPFALFVHWLYTQQLPKTQAEWEMLLVTKFDDLAHWLAEQFSSLLEAYVLGDRFLAPSFRRAINNIFADAVLKYDIWDLTGCSVIPYAIANIPSDRVILQLLVDDYCTEWSFEVGGEAFDLSSQKQLPVSFILRVMKRYKELSSMDELEKENVRCYYEHESEEEKKQCSGQHMVFYKEVDSGYFE